MHYWECVVHKTGNRPTSPLQRNDLDSIIVKNYRIKTAFKDYSGYITQPTQQKTKGDVT